ncbi:MAG: hypothetical protein LBO06_05340 [Bacteroidales bacterium]|jgi:hypothetical protein|nr:hypothetical protein [Bacteroidales bacterium]
MKKVFFCALAVALLGTATMVAQNPPVKSEAKTEKKSCCDKKGDVKAEKCDKATHKCDKAEAKTGDNTKQCCKKEGQKADKQCCKKDGEKSCCKDKAKAEKK